MQASHLSIWSSLTLLGVLVAIPLALWLLKKLPGFGGRASASGSMTVLDSIALGPRERLLVVRVGDEHLLLAATAQSINLLSRLDDWTPPPPGAKVSFAQVFARTRGGESPR